MSIQRRLTITPHIHWHEGMMLTPQHFQQYEFRQYQLLSHQLNLLSSHHWGAHVLNVDQILLTDGIIRILELEAVMPDGLIVNYTSDMVHAPPLELDIRSIKPTTSREEITIFLSMPERSRERSSVMGDFPRFYSIEGDPVKDDNAPDNVVTIPRLFPRLILSTGDKAPNLCIGFPILKLVYDEAYVRTHFVPPCFFVTHDMHLWKQCAEITHRIREKAIHLSEKWQNQMGSPMMHETEMLLRPLVTTLPSLETLVNTTAINPYVLFQKMCDVAGHLAALRLSQLPPVLHAYNHNDINNSFAPLIDLLHQYLNSIEQAYAIFAFQQRERLFYMRLHKQHIHKTLLVGIRTPKGMTETNMEEWMMDAIICCDFAIETARTRRITGARRARIQGEALSELMPGRGMVLFEIMIDPDFIDIDQNLNIFNPSDTLERRPTEIIFYTKKSEYSDKGSNR